jgi:hypothetical protein
MPNSNNTVLTFHKRKIESQEIKVFHIKPDTGFYSRNEYGI